MNTLLRNKAVRTKGFFTKRAFGEQAFAPYTPRQLLDMGKTQMCNVLCAYEGDLPGSAAEKLRQRADLEGMLNMLEEESRRKAEGAMPALHEALAGSLAEGKAWLRDWGRVGGAADDGTKAAVEAAERELGLWTAPAAAAAAEAPGPAAPEPETPAVPEAAQEPAAPSPPPAPAPQRLNSLDDSEGENGEFWGGEDDEWDLDLASMPAEFGPVDDSEGDNGEFWGGEDADSELDLASMPAECGPETAAVPEPAQEAAGAAAAPDAPASGDSVGGPAVPPQMADAAPAGTGAAPRADASLDPWLAPREPAWRGAEELLRERRRVLSALQAGVQTHARHRREAEQGGGVAAHFVTLTTAVYQWDDLAQVLEKYEKGIEQYRHGRRDPLEPGEEALPDRKRRALQYAGVVAWYCAMKLELYAKYVLAYDDYFGVFEWGGGGILHMHLLYWLFPGYGRYDRHEGRVPEDQLREDARVMAQEHGAELSEWNLARSGEWPAALYDEGLTEENPVGEYGPVPLSDGSDGSDCEESGGEETAALEEEPLARLRTLLEDADWHPSALPMDLKKLLLSSRSTRVRRMFRWYLARLTNKTLMHDRHAGEPVTIQPAYGADSASDCSEQAASSGEEGGGPGRRTVELRVLTWNTCVDAECDFVAQAAKDADVLCLQEVTLLSADVLAEKLGEAFHVVTPVTCGGSFSNEGIGTAILARKALFEVQAAKDAKFPATDQERSLLTVRLRVQGSRMSLLVATAHLESGCEGEALRRQQLAEVRTVLGDDAVDAALFAGDLNLREREEPHAQGLGEDAWRLAGGDERDRWTWQPTEAPGAGPPPVAGSAARGSSASTASSCELGLRCSRRGSQGAAL